MKKPVLAALAVFIALVATGCGELEVVDPVIDISEHRTVAVVPFRDEEFDIGYESPRGCELAKDVVGKFRERGDFKVVPLDKVVDLYDPSSPHPPTAREVAMRTTADYVLMADVVHWQIKDDDTTGGLLHGVALIDVSIYETYDAAVERAKTDREKAELPDPGFGRVVVAKKRVKATFPREYGLTNIGVMDSNMTADQVEDGLKLAAAQQVSWLLISHTKDDEKRAEGK